MTREEAVKELSALITRVPDFAVSLDMAITALQADGDCISRQAAIDLIEGIETERLKGNIGLLYAPAIKGLRALPSAYPEERTEKRTETHACDCINRQAVIDALANMYHSAEKWGKDAKDDNVKVRAESSMATLIEIKLRIEKLPPEQPEPCEDAVSRKAVANMLDNIEIPRNASWYLYYHQALDRLTKLPSAQPDVIRCQDCKYASPNGVYGCRLERFSAHDEGTRLFADDYCSMAERRTDG